MRAEDFAKNINCSLSHLHNIEAGAANPSYLLMGAIGFTLDRDPITLEVKRLNDWKRLFGKEIMTKIEKDGKSKDLSTWLIIGEIVRRYYEL